MTFAGRTVLAFGLLAALPLLSRAAPAPESSEHMQLLPGGTYVPFYKRESAGSKSATAESSRAAKVESFLLDRFPATNREYLAFVASHPEWKRSRVAAIFADGHYLAHWASDLVLREASDAGRPVTNVSWFAAQAYCRAQGKSLPTTDQWEYALADSGRDSAGLRTRILAWYGKPGAQEIPPVNSVPLNGYGIGGLSGLVWEWTLDFNSQLSGQDLRGQGTRFCGGGSEGVADASDYASFMRYAMRQSLKASYTLNNLGFRCAMPAP